MLSFKTCYQYIPVTEVESRFNSKSIICINFNTINYPTTVVNLHSTGKKKKQNSFFILFSLLPTKHILFQHYFSLY